MIDAGRKQDIGNHIVAIQPMVFERMMDRYMKVTCQGGYFKTDKQEVKLQSVELDYFFLNSGTAEKPDWQGVGKLRGWTVMYDIQTRISVVNAD